RGSLFALPELSLGTHDRSLARVNSPEERRFFPFARLVGAAHDPRSAPAASLKAAFATSVPLSSSEPASSDGIESAASAEREEKAWPYPFARDPYRRGSKSACAAFELDGAGSSAVAA